MKRTRTKLAAIAVTVLMALLGIIAGFGGLSQKAYADDGANLVPKESCVVYYFSDYYPTLSIKEFGEEFGNVPVYYDFQYFSEREFRGLITGGNFFDLDRAETAVIDIKTFKPDANTLNQLFDILKAQVNEIMFISAYPAGDYGDTTFGGKVDSFIYDNCTRLEAFIELSLIHLTLNYFQLSNTVILLDEKLVDRSVLFYGDMDIICQSSPYVRILLEQLAEFMNYNLNYSSYNEIANLLAQDNVSLVVNYDDYKFMDLISGESDNESVNVCAMGFWHLGQYFYNYLKGAQQQAKNNGGSLPVFIFEVEPIVYSPGELEIITDSYLLGTDYYDEAARTVKDILRSWL